MNFLFTCGGTAGHINPALAIAEALRNTAPDSKFLFIGADREMEKRLIPKAGYVLKNIKMSGLKRGFSPKALMHNFKTMINLNAASKEAAKILCEFKPNAAIGTGGYICYPVLKKASRMGIPTVVHESNAMPGLSTRMLSGIVDKVLVSFHGLEPNYKRPERVVFTGTPVRGGFRATDCGGMAKKAGGKPMVLSFWGSLGAEKMDVSIAEFIKLNIESGEFDHVHATGKQGGADEMMERLIKMGVAEDLPAGVEINEYIDDIHSVMALADIVLCRAGGSTVAELTAMGKPAVLIPSPYVSNNEQETNAQQLEKGGGAIIMEERNCTGEALFKKVGEILNDGVRLKSMSASQESLGAPNAAQEIAELILSLVKSNNL